MAVFTYSEETIQSLVHKAVQRQRWIYAIAAAWLAVDMAVVFGLFFWPEIRINLSDRWIILPFVIPFVLLSNSFNFRKRIPGRFEAYLRSYSVDVSPYSVRVQNDLGPQRQFARGEILRVEESSWGGGLYLRSSNRYRWLMIPHLLDGYSEIKSELGAMGIPFERKLVPTNWEEFVMVLLLCGTLLCDLMTRNRQILIANLIVAVLVGIGGFLIVGANPDRSSRVRWARFAAFLPAAFTATRFFL